MKKNILRCACCDMKFDSNTTCQEHFESDQHKIVAIMTWIRYVAKMDWGIYENFLGDNTNDHKKTWKCCICGKVNFSAVCLVVSNIWFDYCPDCYELLV